MMDIETCKKLIYCDGVYEQMKPEHKRLVDAKDKSFIEALKAIVCHFEEKDWALYNYAYVGPACESLKAIGDASAVRPILEFLDASHAKDEGSTPFDRQFDLLDALVPPSGWASYRDLLQRLAKHGRRIGGFAADRLLMLDAALAGTYDRLSRAAKDLDPDADDGDFQAALELLEADRSGLAIRYLVLKSPAIDSESGTAWKVAKALERIGAPAIPQITRLFDEEADFGADTFAIGFLEKMGESGAPALIVLMRDKEDPEAYLALERLHSAGKIRPEDKQALVAMQGRTLRRHTDQTANCGVHSDIAEVKVSL